MSNYPQNYYQQRPGSNPQSYDYNYDRRAYQQQPQQQYGRDQYHGIEQQYANPQQFIAGGRPPQVGGASPRSPNEYGHPGQHPPAPPGPPGPYAYRHPSSPKHGRQDNRAPPPSGLMSARYYGPNGQYVPPNRGYSNSLSPTASSLSSAGSIYREPKEAARGQPAGYNLPPPRVYSNGYRGSPSNPDISTSMQNMSIQDTRRRPSAPVNYPSGSFAPVNYNNSAPYNNPLRPQSPGMPATPTGQAFRKPGDMAPPPAIYNAPSGRASPVAMAQRRVAAPGPAPAASATQYGAYGTPRRPSPPEPTQYAGYDSIAYTDDNAPPSPTAVTADYGYGRGDGYIKAPKISTNKIPLSSKVVNSQAMSGAEYTRRDNGCDNDQQYSQQEEYPNDRNCSYDSQYQQYSGQSFSQNARPPQQQPQQTQQQPPEAKPPPRRQYNTADPLHEMPEEKNKQLTVEDFELLRKRARVQAHDPKVQLELAKNLVEASSALADRYSDPNTPGHAPDGKTQRKNREAWSAQAYKITKKLASAQYPDAMFYLGSNYNSGGLGLEVDNEKAYELYIKAAKLDHSESAYRVAVCNEVGAGTRKDYEKALIWYKKAASLGNVSAMYKLGMISLNGLLDQPRSFTEAVTWLERAADKADSDTPHAVHELGLLYERADTLDMSAINNSGTAMVIHKDERKAFDMFLKAAKLGYSPAQFRLGCCYEYGTLGCPIDPKRSIAWYSKAAEKGEAESELALSGWYLTGSEGILQQSDTEAYLWARRAAEKGLAKAEYALGYFSEVGIGVKADFEEAKEWYYKAAAQKHPKAATRLQELRQAEGRK